jgi:hypothetical protein
LIYDAMRAHPTNSAVQEEATHALGNFAFGACVQSQQLIASTGGIKLIIQAIRVNKADEDGRTIVRGFCALVRLASFNPENQRLIAEAGGVAEFVDAMDKTLPGSTLLRGNREDILKWSAFSLWHCLSSPETHPKFLDPSAIDVVERAIAKFPKVKELQHCLDSLQRKESPAVEEAKRRGCCTLVTAPLCTTSTPCPAARGLYCEKCAIPQHLWHCVTCSDNGERLCFHCAKAHSGHNVVAVYRPGNCDSGMTIKKR